MLALIVAGGCTIEPPAARDGLGAASGRGSTGGAGAGGLTSTAGKGGSAGSAVTTAGSAGTAAGASGTGVSAGSGGGGSGGTLGGSGGIGSGGIVAGGGGVVGGSGGTSSGGGGTGGEPCVDVEPPPDPEWPGAMCQNWANETTACSESWFANYCDVSCGRCVPQGSGGSGGTAGGGGSGGAPPCVNVEPPADPEWPGATCENWATETTACGESWFANYCDVSCGRCVPEGGGGTGGMTGVDCSSEGLPNVTGGDGFATRYWDCCQTHCSQFDGHRCSQDGVSSTGNTQSACTGGSSFACYDQSPRAVSDCLSYGYIAKTNPNCGGCYRIQFTGQGQHNANDPGSKLIKGKQMIVKVSNTGGDVAGNQFDLMIPGGGVGQFNACSRQWNTSDLGAQYGGFLTECSGAHSAKKECVRTECMKIPAGAAREGCLWFVDWFEVADNPKFTSQSTNCPF